MARNFAVPFPGLPGLTAPGLAAGLPGTVAVLALCLGLAGCYQDQQKQLAACETSATRTGSGQPLKSIIACMDGNGYNFVGYANTVGFTVDCDLPSVIQGVPSATATGAQCFEPKGWLALKIYHIEVPVKDQS